MCVRWQNYTIVCFQQARDLLMQTALCRVSGSLMIIYPTNYHTSICLNCQSLKSFHTHAAALILFGPNGGSASFFLQSLCDLRLWQRKIIVGSFTANEWGSCQFPRLNQWLVFPEVSEVGNFLLFAMCEKGNIQPDSPRNLQSWWFHRLLGTFIGCMLGRDVPTEEKT